ncbi:MAG TPA: single-stranded DNA-binding protein [Phaeodactylibacter sp.]|nr:single-stranded DNA-binding protein [Phaeodactylibacter sp.]
MNSLKNSVKLIGHLGSAPEIKRLDNGNLMAKLSLATNESYKNSKGEKVTRTQWHRLVAWGKVAEVIEKYARKGSEVAIEGMLLYHNYVDKEGVTRYTTDIRINEVLFLSKSVAGG